MKNTFLLEPFSLFTSINLNNSYRADKDPYRYQFNTLITKIQFNFNPEIAKDLFRLRAFLEMFSYSRDMKNYRPLFRIQSFMYKKNLS